jgi:hypothetical protein
LKTLVYTTAMTREAETATYMFSIILYSCPLWRRPVSVYRLPALPPTLPYTYCINVCVHARSATEDYIRIVHIVLYILLRIYVLLHYIMCVCVWALAYESKMAITLCVHNNITMYVCVYTYIYIYTACSINNIQNI